MAVWAEDRPQPAPHPTHGIVLVTVTVTVVMTVTVFETAALFVRVPEAVFALGSWGALGWFRRFGGPFGLLSVAVRMPRAVLVGMLGGMAATCVGAGVCC
jgi:hypothetical protein